MLHNAAPTTSRRASEISGLLLACIHGSQSGIGFFLDRVRTSSAGNEQHFELELSGQGRWLAPRGPAHKADRADLAVSCQ